MRLFLELTIYVCRSSKLKQVVFINKYINIWKKNIVTFYIHPHPQEDPIFSTST